MLEGVKTVFGSLQNKNIAAILRSSSYSSPLTSSKPISNPRRGWMKGVSPLTAQPCLARIVTPTEIYEVQYEKYRD